MNAFYSCASCASYVKERDPVCPFCGTARAPQSRTTPRRALPPGMSRGQWLVLGSALAVAGCQTQEAAPTFECLPGSGVRCDRWTQYCAVYGPTVDCLGFLPGDGGKCERYVCRSSDCAAPGKTNACSCDDDNEGGVVVNVSCVPSGPGGAGCYGAPPARLERLAAS